MNFDDYKLITYDKLHQDIKEVCQINMIEGICTLWIQHGNVKVTVDRFFEDVVFLNSTGKVDINGKEIYEGHIIKSNLSGEKMLVNYGEYEAYCPTDRQYMNNVGFYVSAEGYPDMPLGSTEEYAEIVGHANIKPKWKGKE